MKISKGQKLIAAGILLVVLDQVIKLLVKDGMVPGEQIDVLGDWFKLCYVENEGMAFGMKFGGVAGKLILSVFRILLLGGLVWWIRSLYLRTPSEDGSKPAVPTGVLAGLTLIAAGAAGNIIDSMIYGPFLFGKVVDMFYFPLFTWPEWLPFLGGHIFFEPVFNFADSCVTIGALYLLIFQYKFFSSPDKKPLKEKN